MTSTTPRCSAPTRSGYPCPNSAGPSGVCGVHHPDAGARRVAIDRAKNASAKDWLAWEAKRRQLREEIADLAITMVGGYTPVESAASEYEELEAKVREYREHEKEKKP